jgi:hypothetical protein
LTGEWEAAIKEGDCMRRKLEKQKLEMETIKQKGYESEEELKQKIGNPSKLVIPSPTL